QGREGADLAQDVGRGIQQRPLYAITADGNGRLGARPGADPAFAQAVAAGAVAVPLREATAGGGAEYMNVHQEQVRAERNGRTIHLLRTMKTGRALWALPLKRFSGPRRTSSLQSRNGLR